MPVIDNFPNRNQSLVRKVAATGFVLFGLYLLSPVVVITAGDRGVMTTFGRADDQVYQPGIHFRIPLAQSMHMMDVRLQKGEGEGDAASKDLQSVHTRIAINYHLDPKDVVNVFRNIGPSADIAADRIIIPAAQEAVKAVTARFTAEELVSRRTEVRDAIGALLREKMQRHGLMLDEFAIVNFAFSRSFSEAIEAKVKAEQEKLKAERDLQRIEVEAKQKVASAKAEADALALQRQQITADLLALRRIENEREAIRKWDGKLPNVTGGTVPFIQVDGKH
ncbi:MAG: prohibitin family protein [Aquabacterium sp.]|uniref:prohibitin family protein n=1 Tax=Aquabacterium sp. TaxID=1872578 RepID=UPI0025C130DE|nr:prohibitin family protein [Aquabacterium sp.]MBI3382411.1 prohibitin family protein [Aquabacterium sp.]